MLIDSHFPGGNIVVDSIDGNTAFVRQDIRDTTEWWFWWDCRVTQAHGQTITLRFGDGDVFATPGPCASWDGIDWQWLGRPETPQTSLTVAIPPGIREAWFALAPLYTQATLERCLDRSDAAGRIRRERLCLSEKGRPVELLRIPAARSAPAKTVVAIARTHACEMNANFVLEGLLSEWALNDRELIVIPFVDKDGVEDGDQGKCRSPHDHNRDFLPAPRYASVRALQELLLGLGDRLELFLDLHCPWVRGDINDTIFSVGCPPPWQDEVDRLAGFIQKYNTSGLAFGPRDLMPYGKDWNVNLTTSAAGWVRERLAPRAAYTLEIAYGHVHGVATSPEKLRAFGGAAARGIEAYLR